MIRYQPLGAWSSNAEVLFECIDFDQTQSSSCQTTAVLNKTCFNYILIITFTSVLLPKSLLFFFFFSISMRDRFRFIRLTKPETVGTIKLD